MGPVSSLIAALARTVLEWKEGWDRTEHSSVEGRQRRGERFALTWVIIHPPSLPRDSSGKNCLPRKNMGLCAIAYSRASHAQRGFALLPESRCP